ncbi:MAG: hypothetical protein SVK08_00510 [Halobacteriota archaeon]|nr:hypothetical protein [Halobacteriota archaeon]
MDEICKGQFDLTKEGDVYTATADIDGSIVNGKGLSPESAFMELGISLRIMLEDIGNETRHTSCAHTEID